MWREIAVWPRREQERDFWVFKMLCTLICVLIPYMKIHASLHLRFMYFNMLSLNKKAKQNK